MNMYLIYFFIGLIFSFINVPLLIRFANRYSIVDNPDGKLKKHIMTTPYLGGMAIYICFVFLYIFTSYINFYLFFGLSLLVILGLIDDLRNLSPSYKLAGQAFSSIFLLLSLNYNPSTFIIFNLFSYFFKYFFILTIINVFNLVDIMDGLASIISIGSASILLILSIYYDYSFLSILLISFLGSILGFLYYNLPQAKIYLGDLGSMLIGGFLSYCCLEIVCNIDNLILSSMMIVVPFSIPLLELLGLIIIRSYNNIPFYQGSPHHFAIYLKNKKWPIKYILLYTFCMMLVFNLNFLLLFFKKINLIVFLAISILMIILWCFILIRFDKGKAFWKNIVKFVRL